MSALFAYDPLTDFQVRMELSGSALFDWMTAPVGPNEIHPTQYHGVKLFLDDLALGRSVVLSRADSTLRSFETQPQYLGFLQYSLLTMTPIWKVLHYLDGSMKVLTKCQFQPALVDVNL